MLAGSPMLPMHFRANFILSSRPLLIASSAKSWMGYRQSTVQSFLPNAYIAHSVPLTRGKASLNKPTGFNKIPQ